MEDHMLGSRFAAALAGFALAIVGSASPSVADPTTGTVEANGLTIVYEEQGQGPPVVLLHGGSLTHRSWQWFAPEAATKYRVIAPDSRGHGQTDNPAGTFSYERWRTTWRLSSPRSSSISRS
jgi:alpha/beta hydrolase fold